MKKKIRVGIIGCGGISKGSHMSAYEKLGKRVEVAALCDIILERAETARETRFPSADVFLDYMELLKDVSIDYVDI